MTKAELDKFCMALKGTTKDIKWGNDLCYCIGKKMYCVTSLEGPVSLSFKATEEEFAVLTERRGVVPAPYAARYFWVYLKDITALKPSEIKEGIRNSYNLVFEKLPRKVRETILNS